MLLTLTPSLAMTRLAQTQSDTAVVVLQVGDAAMVLSLADLEGVEDRNLLAGSLMVLLEQDIHQAQVTIAGCYDVCDDVCDEEGGPLHAQ